jgi:hypothetical protein
VIDVRVKEVPVEGCDTIACVDEREADPTGQAPCQLMEKRERQKLEAVRRRKGDRLVKPVERLAVRRRIAPVSVKRSY